MPAQIRHHLLRITLAVGSFLPAVIVVSIVASATPDLETWLKQQTGDYFRPDAFEDVNEIATVCASLFSVVSFNVSLSLATHHDRYIASLLAGNVLGTLCYLIGYGFSDPAWFTFAALNEIGMLVSIVVTGLWVACRG